MKTTNKELIATLQKLEEQNNYNLAHKEYVKFMAKQEVGIIALSYNQDNMELRK